MGTGKGVSKSDTAPVPDPTQRRHRRWTADSRLGRDRQLHSAVPGIGHGHQLRFPSRRVTRMPERAIATHGKAQSNSCDNGPELTSRHNLAWAIEWKIEPVHIQPGTPPQSGGMESFNGKLPDEC